MKYLNFGISQLKFGFSFDHTNYIMELVSEWFPGGTFRKFDTPVQTVSMYENELMYVINPNIVALSKSEH